jgi:hypothetical protein
LAAAYDRTRSTAIGPEWQTAASGVDAAVLDLPWAWVELNYRPHAYQLCKTQHEVRQGAG